MWRTRRSTEVLSLVVHGPEFHNGKLLVLNPELFPDVQLLDLVEIAQPDHAHPRLVLSVESLTPVRGKLQVSVAKEIAAQFELEAFRPVTVRRVDRRSVRVEFVELSIKDQFLSRADIWRLKGAMLGQCVYVGRTVEVLGIRSQVDAILAGNVFLKCGVIGNATKIVVRSRSSRLFWLVQMSTEMWEFAPNGEIYYEKLLHQLLRVLIAKWNESSVSHSVTIIAFSRSFYDSNQFPDTFDPTKAPFSDPCRQSFNSGYDPRGYNMANRCGPTIHLDPDTGRFYEDFYKVVVANFTGPDWNQLLQLLKLEFVSYHKTHRWRTPEQVSYAQYEICHYPDVGSDDFSEKNLLRINNAAKFSGKKSYVNWTKLPLGVPSRAKEGNILEAINVTLNVLDKHYMDRDLSRTGQGIVMLTAGCSIFSVNRKLAEITEQRMMDNGVGMDMISLSTPPLHVVPLFIYSNLTPEVKTATSVENNLSDFIVGDVAVASEVSRSLDNPSFLNRTSSLLSQPKSSEGVQSGVYSLNRSSTSAMHETNKTIAGDNPTYDVPHWVNITFLDFGCNCGTPTISLPHETVLSGISHNLQKGLPECVCQVKLSHHFTPLPLFRMFDADLPYRKIAFPVTLRNLMLKDLSIGKTDKFTDSHAGKEMCINSKSSTIAGNLLLFNDKIESLLRQRAKNNGLSDLTSSILPLEPYRQSLTSGLNALSQIRTATHLSASLHARVALEDYDKSVFALDKEDEESTVMLSRNRRLVEPTSATIGGDGAGHLEWFRRNARKEAERKKERSSSGLYRRDASFLPSESTSMLQMLLSPRNVKIDSKISNNLMHFASSMEQQSSSPRVPVAYNSTFKVHEKASMSEQGMVKSNMEQQKVDDTSPFASRMKLKITNTIYDSPERKRGEMFQPLPRAMTSTAESKSFKSRLSAANSPLQKEGWFNGYRVTKPCNSPISPVQRNQSNLFRMPRMNESQNLKAALASNIRGVATEHPKVCIFQYARGDNVMRLSSDRRRWSHLFPESDQNTPRVFKDGEEDFVTLGEPRFRGPNWQSLTLPAILPLTTDHFPSTQELNQGYTEAFYTLTIPTTATQSPKIDCVPRYRNHNELLLEIICQRLARDFQLVSTCDSTADLMASDTPLEGRTRVYRLSMGHRIHQLIYDAERQTVEVKRFVQREPHNPKAAFIIYNYSLWVGLTQSFQPHQQTFHRYPQPEDNWNALDNLLCGYLDDMADSMKCRRIRFAFVPPDFSPLKNDVENHNSARTYAAKFTKLIEYLQSRVAPTETGDVEQIAIKIVLKNPEAKQNGTTTLPLGKNGTLNFKMNCKALTSLASKFKDSRIEWVMMRLEETMNVSRFFDLDVRWLACSGIAADEFVSTLRRRAKQAGLDLRRVPEYSRVSRIQFHPLVGSVFLPLPSQIYEYLIIAMTQSLGFVLDDEQIADGVRKKYGIGIDQKASNSKSTIIMGHRCLPPTDAPLATTRLQTIYSSTNSCVCATF
ncbi:hypothetical protein CCR75_003923 [Bremia lactucae]|uniref:DEP domain-containing protein n=1 Tax=Bremia lactucae TaxID=4779 RepID=A0A976FEZ3_BRELC|nr:hypothetical protein CCR75_003923 [Bremia lactucae]